MGTYRAYLRRAFDAAVAAADPAAALEPHLPPAPPRGRVIVLALGKAAAVMAAAVEAHYLPSGVAVTGVAVTSRGNGVPLRAVRCLEAAHPVPDAGSVTAAEALLAAADGARGGDLVLLLVSGGGSSLAFAPRAGLALADVQALGEALLASGAAIGEINLVRRHLCRVKDGRLARRAAPATVLALAVSDVVGDDAAAIASGPSAPDGSTPTDALALLDRLGIAAPSARAALRRAAAEGDAPRPGDAALAHVETRVIASNQASLDAAARAVEALGYRPFVLSNAVTGEAREAGAWHAAVALQAWRHGQPAPPPLALLSGGETVVTLTGPAGRGGRNSTFALAFALALPEGGDAPIAALAADSDGIDGVGGHAGAVVTPALLRGWDRRAAAEALERFDSYAPFAAADHLLVTGPTRTNVNDLRVVLVGDPSGPMR